MTSFISRAKLVGMRRTYFFPAFAIALILLVVLFLLGRIGTFSFLTDGIQFVTYPVASLFRNLTIPSQKEIDTLKKQNMQLLEKLAAMSQLEADNRALRDQFNQSNPSSKNLLPAEIVGEQGAIPNISFPENIVLDKGSLDGVHGGMSVIVGQELVGIISQVTNHFAQVTLASNKNSSFSVRDSKTGALGVARGMGNGELLLDNVLLSDSIATGDIITTLGTQTISGKGIPPDFIVGKIVSVDKKSSSLFQTAQLAPLVALDRLQTVFILMQ